MSAYRFSVSIIKASTGGGAVASAAYRSGSKLKDSYNNREFDYTLKKDVAHSEIIAPKGAPEWVYDRGKLWNSVMERELGKRGDAQLAREVQLNLPVELSLQQNVQIVREYVKENFVSMGMIGDINIHNAKGNPHAHVMLTMRRLDRGGGIARREENGTGGISFSMHFLISLDFHFFQKPRNLNMSDVAFFGLGIQG